jgi:hypothetical protein
MIHLHIHAAFNPKKGEWQAVNFDIVPPGLGLRTVWVFTVAISLGCNIFPRTVNY